MYNEVINAVIALIEDRPHNARQILRAPGVNVPISAVQARLNVAVENREKKAKIEVLKEVLRRSLRAQPKEKETSEAFFEGVSHVESIAEVLLGELESGT